MSQVMLAAHYARAGTEDQTKGTSLDDQIRPFTEYIELQWWSLAGRFVDAGISRTRADSPEFPPMMREAEAGHLDYIVVTKVDRLARKTSLSQTVLAPESNSKLGSCPCMRVWTANSTVRAC